MKNILFSAIASTFVAGLVSIPASASATVITFANSDFVTFSGAVDNTALNSGVLNTTSGAAPFPNAAISPNGFAGFFTAPFVSLGALGTQTIANSNAGQNNASRSTTPFNLSSGEAASPLLFTFNYAFAGNSALTPDNFRAGVVDPSDNLVPFGPPPLNLNGNGPMGFIQSLNNFSFLYPANTFTAGIDYRLIFVLNENILDGSENNTAGGFNNVSITTNVPFEFTPLTGLVGLGAIFGASNIYKRRKKLFSHFSAKTEPKD